MFEKWVLAYKELCNGKKWYSGWLKFADATFEVVLWTVGLAAFLKLLLF